MSDSSAERAEQTTAETGSKPLTERPMPQTSIRFFLILISVCALVMLVFQSAAAGIGWARVAALLISTIVGCFVTYAGSFVLGNLFSFSTAPIADALDLVNRPNASDPSAQDQERS